MTAQLSTKWVRITKGVVIRGFPGVNIGDVIEMPATTANEVVNCGYGEYYVASAAPVDRQEPIVESRDPQPRVSGPRKTSKAVLP